MRKITKALLIILILSSCISCDQITKSTAQTHLTDAQPVTYMDGVVQFQYTENAGAMLGLGAKLPSTMRTWTLIIFNSAMLIGLLGLIWKTQEITWIGLVGSALIIGGGLSNIVDRLFNDGMVVDFMHIGIGSLRTGIFNLADVAIMAGAGLMLIWGLKNRKSENELSKLVE